MDGIGEVGVLPRKLVARDVQVADAVGRGAGDDVRAPAGGVHVADAAPGAGLGAGKGRDAGGEVVGLGGEDDVVPVERPSSRRARARPGCAGTRVRIG